MMKKFTAALILVALCVPAFGYDFSRTRKDTPADFNSFLDDCTESERIQLMQSLQGFSSDYNTADVEDVLQAVRAGKLAREDYSPEAIRKMIVWRSYNKLTYLFRNDKEVDYHGILQWAAKKADITSRRIDDYSTFDLEKEVSEEYFAKAWDKFTPAERAAMLAAGSVVGSAAAGAAGVTAFVAMPSAAAYAALAASPTIPIIPVAALVWKAWSSVSAESGPVSALVITVNIIKSRKY